jgi:hypothetical protein
MTEKKKDFIKRIIKSILVCILIWAVVFGAATGAVLLERAEQGNEADLAVKHLYPLSTVVDRIDKENDVVSCVDYNGNVWEFTGIAEWREGDFATFLMNDKGTRECEDDEIVKIEYNGNVEGLN